MRDFSEKGKLNPDVILSIMQEETCDWSLFPTLTLPKVEVRHFSTENGDNIFVRNLYEVRRIICASIVCSGAGSLTRRIRPYSVCVTPFASIMWLPNSFQSMKPSTVSTTS